MECNLLWSGRKEENYNNEKPNEVQEPVSHLNDSEKNQERNSYVICNIDEIRITDDNDRIH